MDGKLEIKVREKIECVCVRESVCVCGRETVSVCVGEGNFCVIGCESESESVVESWRER